MMPVTLRPIFEKLTDAFRLSMDTPWFRMIMENSPLHNYNLRRLSDFFTRPDTNVVLREELEERLLELEVLIAKIREYILPFIKEKLQISSLAPDDIISDQDERVLRRFVAYTLPHNLSEIERLIGLIRRDQDAAYPPPEGVTDRKAAS
ncbi:MAG TPA: hypothetical protein ENN69_03575 [Spirochaetia bacterium]|nr:hypothetical protein [Spirochaetia bacterium]